MARVERVSHVLRIDEFRFDFSHGVADPKFSRDAYYDHRSIDILVTIENPSIRAKNGLVICRPALINRVRAPGKETKPVGSLWYRADGYRASIYFPEDLLSAILIMLTSGQYRYLQLEADPGGREAAIYDFSFSAERCDDGAYLDKWSPL
jgi:hypothetical protein